MQHRLLRYFEYKHLPPKLQSVSIHFHDLAHFICQLDSADGAEQTVALRKLLEAKDAAVRCVLVQ